MCDFLLHCATDVVELQASVLSLSSASYTSLAYERRPAASFILSALSFRQ